MVANLGRRGVEIVVAACTLWPWGVGISDSLEPPPEAGAPGEAPALGGPSVKDREVTSLVRMDMNGKLVRLDVRPEQAALDLIVLEPETRERARAAVERWKEAVAQHLVDNVELVVQYTDANRAGDKAGAKKAGDELFERFDAAKRRDPVVEYLEGVLTPDELARLRGIVDEYWEALITAEIGGKKDQDRDKVQRRLSMGMFQGEAVAAYGAFFKPLERKVEAVFTAVDPTPEQREAIRDAAVRYVREGRLHPGDEERHALARRVYDALDEERRVKLIAAAVGAL
jgi:hypothetical protein